MFLDLARPYDHEGQRALKALNLALEVYSMESVYVEEGTHDIGIERAYVRRPSRNAVDASDIFELVSIKEEHKSPGYVRPGTIELVAFSHTPR
jgi:hypothetical protein